LTIKWADSYARIIVKRFMGVNQRCRPDRTDPKSRWLLATIYRFQELKAHGARRKVQGSKVQRLNNRLSFDNPEPSGGADT
jgi:hypothetical protein